MLPGQKLPLGAVYPKVGLGRASKGGVGQLPGSGLTLFLDQEWHL